ncbi:MAG: lysine exporter LysO family protein [Candidatus Edwardsbacteria bacterium]|nr:lysine exporter LysO family protein [Candidatus Edwardsbacteria bacterium]MBU1576357.1 lysine exporter LysO family protein [Candidatus Edwardsbacteria bacterium]MBU2462769.1 lysine exporter LysO family protein [Candidatus Edwardsbacteria bacterium]MBU2593534.1 lysine exporter LysO family protein [Candidatus Edwardsbacteria bacterium]
MFTVLAIMSAGIILGYMIRNKIRFIKYIDHSINIAIYLLLFLLGISVGGNRTVMDNLGSLGFNALLLAAGAVAGSVGLSYLTYKLFFAADK